MGQVDVVGLSWVKWFRDLTWLFGRKTGAAVREMASFWPRVMLASCSPASAKKGMLNCSAPACSCDAISPFGTATPHHLGTSGVTCRYQGTSLEGSFTTEQQVLSGGLGNVAISYKIENKFVPKIVLYMSQLKGRIASRDS
jgi:hypothetical protein